MEEGRRLILPYTLPSVPPRLRKALWLLWGLFLLLALIGQAGGASRALAYGEDVDRAFASLGLTWYEYEDGVVVSPASPAAERMGIGEEVWVYGVDGRRLADGATPRDLARLLSGPDGSQVELELEVLDSDRSATVRLTRSAANRALVEPQLVGAEVQLLLDALAAAALFLAAFMLLRRRGGEAVPAAFAVSFAAIGTWGSKAEDFWTTTAYVDHWAAPIAFGLCLLIAVFPAYPNGRYEPRWTRWMLLAGPLLLIVGIFELDLALLALLPLLCLALWAVARRYAAAGPSLERQQMKWGAFGFLGSLPLLITAAMFMATASTPGVAGTGAASWLVLIAVIMAYAALIMIPIGVMLSLLQYRLNDADAAIGRSAGYATVTILIGAVWAITTSWTNGLLAKQLGVDGSAIAPGLSAIVAAAVFAPVNRRMTGWIDAKFQGALLHMRSLPERLAKWQHGDDPEEVADAALGAIVRGVQAEQAALVAAGDGEPRVLAAHGLTPAEVEAALGEQDESLATEAHLFPLHLPLTSGAEAVGMLLLGRRSDGASYSRAQRAAITAVEEPLADAIRFTSRRAARDAALNRVIEAMGDRLADRDDARRKPPASAAARQ